MRKKYRTIRTGDFAVICVALGFAVMSPLAFSLSEQEANTGKYLEMAGGSREEIPVHRQPSEDCMKMKIIGECGGMIPLNPVKLEDKPLTIGRSRSCRLQLKDKKVSSRHCLIAGSDGKLVLCDLGSKKGTRLNGRPLKPNRNIVLHSGYVINIGDTKMEIHHA